MSLPLNMELRGGLTRIHPTDLQQDSESLQSIKKTDDSPSGSDGDCYHTDFAVDKHRTEVHLRNRIC